MLLVEAGAESRRLASFAGVLARSMPALVSTKAFLFLAIARRNSYNSPQPTRTDWPPWRWNKTCFDGLSS